MAKVFVLLSFHLIIIITLITSTYCLYTFLLSLIFSSVLPIHFIRSPRCHRVSPLIRNEPVYKMPLADIGSLRLQETNGCVCYLMPFGFLEQGKTTVFVSNASLFVYLAI